MDSLAMAWAVAMTLGALAFSDTARRLRRQTFVVHRTRDRMALFAVELALVAGWAALRWIARLDRPLVPASALESSRAAGLALTVAGLGLAVWAKARLGRWFSGTFGVQPGHELVTDGPYAITRHPIYTGLLAAVAGSALVWDSALTLALAAVLVVPFARHTAIEETLFVGHFGDAYRRYQRRVPRLVPFAIRPREDA